MNITMLVKRSFTLTALSSFFFCQLALATPDGAQVVAGSASVTQTTNQTTINQTSQNTVINWNNFNTASQESVLFNQPNASSIALNRINSGLPTTFAGSLSANGQVWILNPAGVLFTSTSQVDVAGLVATTHDISNSNFMSGNYQFSSVPGYENSKIINNGLISAKNSGIVALVGSGVENNGVIIANLGKVHLASGSTFILDMYGDQLINFGSNLGIQNGYVSNSGLIQANGGKVHMTANVAAGVLNNVISMSGTIEAKSVGVNKKGEIVLYASDASTKKLSGTTRVTGKLDASNGGFIETSGQVVVIEPTAEINAGAGGLFLLDPFDITVVAGTGCTNITCAGSVGAPTGTATIGVDTIAAILTTGTSVTLDTGNPGPGGDAGDIYFNASPTIPMPPNFSILTLNAYRDININSTLGFNNQRMFLNAGRNINLAGDIRAAQGLTLSPGLVTAGGQVFVTGDRTISTAQSGTVTTINGAIDGTTSHGDTLHVLSFNPVVFNGAVGATTPLNTLEVAYSSPTLNATWATFIQDQLNNKLTNMIFANNNPFNTPGLVLTVTSSITQTTGTASLAVNGYQGVFSGSNGSVAINAHITLSGGAFSSAVVANPGNTINLGANVDAVGGQIYTGAVVLTGTQTLTSTAGIITFNGTVNALASGAQGLTTTALTTVFNGVVGAVPLNFLRVNGATDINTAAITTTVFQDYTGHVDLIAPNIALTAGVNTTTLGYIIFRSTVDGASNLTATAYNTYFVGSVGSIAPLSSLTVNNPVVTGGGSEGLNVNSAWLSNFAINTMGTQQYNVPVILAGNVLSPDGILPGGFNSASGDVVFNARSFISGGRNGGSTQPSPFSFSASAPLGQVIFGHITVDTDGGELWVDSFHIYGATTTTYLRGTNVVITNGAQTYDGPVLIGGLFSLGFQQSIQAGAVTFNGPVNSPSVGLPGAIQISGLNVPFVSLTNVTFNSNADVGNITPLYYVRTNSNVNFNASIFHTTLYQVFSGNLVFGSQPTATFINDTFGPFGFGRGFIHNSGNITGTSTNVIVQGDFYMYSIPGTNALASLTVNPGSATFIRSGVTITTTGGVQNYGGQVSLYNFGFNGPVTLNGSTITFGAPVTMVPSSVSPIDLIITGNMVANAVIGPSSIPGGFFFAGQDGTLLSLTVNGQSDLNGGLVNTINNQLYNGPVFLGTNTGLTSTAGNIIFNGTIDNAFDLTVTANQVRFKDVVGGINSLGLLTVNANIINFDNAATSTTSLGTQTYTGTGVNPLMTIGLDPLFTAPNFVIAIPLLILADTTYTSTAGDIDFQFTVDGPANLFLNPFAGFSAIFQGSVGAATALASLIITGDTTISGATLIQTNGDQVYSNIMTLNNNLSTTALTTGAIYFGNQNISSSGVFGSGFDLIAVTNNAVNGPTGAGITGIVRVDNFTVGGPGGANLSFNYSAAESFVLTQGAGQAILNTVISPDFRSLAAIYCVNNLCALIPPLPNNVPPTQEFIEPVGPSCGVAGCDNLEIMRAQNNCEYSALELVDERHQVKNNILIKQERDCACKADNKWMKYCKIPLKDKVAGHVSRSS